MKSQELFPLDKREIINSDTTQIKICHNDTITSHLTYVSVVHYCKAIRALEAAEQEIKDLKNQIRINKISAIIKNLE